MSNVTDVNRCLHCSKSLSNRRPHSKHCSSSCRSKSYRSRQKELNANVSVKLVFSKADFNVFKQEAELDGILVNALLARKIHNHSNQYQAI